MKRLDVGAFIEDAKVEFVGRPTFPETEKIHRAGLISDDRDVPGKAENLFRVFPCAPRIAEIVEVLRDLAVEADFDAILRSHDLPGISIAGPWIGLFDLFPVHKFLTEQAELVMDAVTDS